MKTCLTHVVLLFAFFMASDAVLAQTQQTAKNNVEMKPEAQQFDVVKKQVVQITNELKALGVNDIPAYPTYITLESVTAHLEELKALKQRYSQNPN